VLAHAPRRIAGNHRIGQYRLRHDRAGGHNHVRADGDARQHDSACADHRSLADFHHAGKCCTGSDRDEIGDVGVMAHGSAAVHEAKSSYAAGRANVC